MIPVPDYEFYTEVYGGTATEAAFGELLPAAASAVGWLIGFNEPQERHEVPCKRAVCAALDSYATTGTGNVGSMTIGSKDGWFELRILFPLLPSREKEV